MLSEIYDKPGWKVRGDFIAPQSDQRYPFLPRLRHAVICVVIVVRYLIHVVVCWWKGQKVFLNIFQRLRHNPFAGVPCGGIGCGGIGRDFRGGFCRFSLLPGIVEQQITYVKADQFIITIRRQIDGVCVYQKVLTCAPGNTPELSAWDFSFPAQNVHYRGLYPRSWTVFKIPELDISLICNQISPVIPNNYEDSSLPVCLFNWSIENSSSVCYLVSITFTFRNGTGNPAYAKSDCNAELLKTNLCSGIKLHHLIGGLNVSYAIAAKHDKNVSLTYATFDPTSDGSSIWSVLYKHGNLEKKDISLEVFQELAIALCAESVCQPNSVVNIEFLLTWDMPVVKFRGGKREYVRRYRRFFRSKNDDFTTELCNHGFSCRLAWEEQINNWQNKILNDHSLPEWYKSALFNELYYMTDGGTIWVEYDESWQKTERNMSEETIRQFKQYGRFAYLESWEYHMMNTYDVHFYSSFAFMVNWPEIELSIQLDYADQVTSVDHHEYYSLYEGTFTKRKNFGRIPHDLGNPFDEPWLAVNSYFLSDTSEWKDLNLKFILACYRDYELIVKKKPVDESVKLAILNRFHDLVSRIIDDAWKWDTDGDGMIENSGKLDQTYDVWKMDGTSAYCGGLWLCALECYYRLNKQLGRDEEENLITSKIYSARKAYETKLWNGSYFNFDEHCKTIMADQLCAFWYMATIDGSVDQKLIDGAKISAALKTIFNMNVKKFAASSIGSVNGMHPCGEVDQSCIQSEEIWGGTTYALASFYILMNQRRQGFETAQGWYQSCWEKFGLQYQTPEAITDRYYRAIGYMRPLAIWAMQWALEMKKSNM